MAELIGPALSVIVPVHNGTGTLERSLRSVCEQLRPGDEAILVDDGSTDDVAPVAARFPITLLRLDHRSGVAAARNRGADRATRPLLFFVDADVVLHPDVVERGRAHFTDPKIDGVIGSYDDTPEARTVVSQFKNLAHHHFHQRAAGPVGSFWGACGFIRRDVFNKAAGFDESRFSRPSIEDVELGWRVTDSGGHIVLDPAILATHLKRWTLTSLIKTDVVHRAIPWIRWSLERRRLGGELNASPLQQVAMLLAVVLAVSGAASLFSTAAAVIFALALMAALVVNHQLFRLFWRKGGFPLLAGGFVLQQVYYFCGLAGVVAGVARFCWSGRRSVTAPRSAPQT